MEAAAVRSEKSKRVCVCQQLMQDMAKPRRGLDSQEHKVSLGDEVRATLELSPSCGCLVSLALHDRAEGEEEGWD